MAFTQVNFTSDGESGAISVCAVKVSGSIERSVTFDFQSISGGTACKFLHIV